jgi:predicted phosphodiesterase
MAGGGVGGDGELRFFAVGDTGHANRDLQKTVDAMARRAEDEAQSPLAFVLLLGDNFYPAGISHGGVNSHRFQEDWIRPFRLDSEVDRRLQVPFFAVLGNHDYQRRADWRAQIRYSWCKHNPHRLWTMPARCYAFRASTATGKVEGQPWLTGSRRDDFSGDGILPQDAESLLAGVPPWQEEGATDGGRAAAAVAPEDAVDFFALDTNGAQFSVRRHFDAGGVGPTDIEELLNDDIASLREELARSRARVKIVFCHHPMYTRGAQHGKIGLFLQKETDLGNVINGDSAVHLVLSGHEHVLQSHFAQGANHCNAGASGGGGKGYYGGVNSRVKVDWHDNQTFGFLEVTVSASSRKITTRFISSHGEVVHTVESSFGDEEPGEKEDPSGGDAQ